MDIIGELPVEIAEKILTSLDSKDLWRCMAVSKRWRLLANQKRLWKQHCFQIGVPLKKIEENEDVDDELALCSAAAEWRVQRRLISSWRQRKFTLLHWPKHEDPKAYAIYGNRLAVRTENKIHIYIIKKEGTLKVDSINLPWNCFFEFRLMEMNSKYIIVGFNNVILVYELNNTYFLKMAYTFNKDAAMTTKCIFDFIETGRNTFFVNILKIVRLTNDSLWVKVKYMYFHATYFHIDLNSGKATNVFPFRNVKYLCGGDDVLMFRQDEDEVLLLTCKGAKLIQSLYVGQYFSLAGNDNMVAITTDQGLATFEICTGKNLANIATPKFSKYTAVNPVYDIVYCIHEDCESRKDVFSSYSMRSGAKLWSRTLQVKIPEYFHLNAVRISVLYGTFIIIKTGGTDPPCIDLDEHIQFKKEYYVFDASSGELLYHRPYEKFLLFTEFYLCDKKYLRAAI